MNTLDTPTILAIISLIGCIIGVVTFITGVSARGKQNGATEEKLNQALAGISDIKTELCKVSTNQGSLSLLVNSHGEQIKTLFTNISSLENRVDGFKELTEVMTEVLKEVKSK